MNYTRLDKNICSWMEIHGHRLLRYALAAVFIWFGALKPLGLSPAQGLVENTVYWFGPWFVPILGVWEVAIGICLLYRPLIRIGIALMALQMAGTFLPLILLPGITWQGFLTPTLEGQYIIKNLVLITAAIVVGGTVRHKHSKLQE
ncbi:hypothetical protein GOV07_03000 [Candidatus Woesearchaeota archaeon]|nr:hypothetical protein [Candidatus Woesearchaeota archaeon]